MEKITKDIKVYSFDELESDEARAKACQQVGDSMTAIAGWWYDTFDSFVERCKDYGMTIDENDIQFSGFGSQGDGASFVCDNIELKKVLDILGIQVSDGLEEKVLDYIYEVDVIRTSDRAYHEQTVHAEVFIDEDALAEEEEEIRQYIQDIADNLEVKLEALKDDLCQHLYYELEQEYNYLHSAECVDEIAYNNNMLFLANGLVYDWGE